MLANCSPVLTLCALESGSDIFFPHEHYICNSWPLLSPARRGLLSPSQFPPSEEASPRAKNLLVLPGVWVSGKAQPQLPARPHPPTSPPSFSSSSREGSDPQRIEACRTPIPPRNSRKSKSQVTLYLGPTHNREWVKRVHRMPLGSP